MVEDLRNCPPPPPEADDEQPDPPPLLASFPSGTVRFAPARPSFEASVQDLLLHGRL